MALHKAHRPATLKARLNRLERELHPYESPAQRLSRAMVTQWLAMSDDAPELYVAYEDMQQRHGGTTGLLATSAGRALTLSILDDLYETLEVASA